MVEFYGDMDHAEAATIEVASPRVEVEEHLTAEKVQALKLVEL